jgi:hypothetical protein
MLYARERNISGQHPRLTVVALYLLDVVQRSLAKQREYGLGVIIGEKKKR